MKYVKYQQMYICIYGLSTCFAKYSAIISEILDSRTKNVVSKALDSDFVLSNELISMAVAMVSEQREVNCLLKELFSGKGNEL